jgi:thiol-disulfide isomerase/thioredoxin
MADAVTESTFEHEVLQADKPVLVDFWAEWCGPCHAVAPILDRIVEERHGEIKLVKVNIDEEPEIAERYGSPRSRRWCSSRTASLLRLRSALSRRRTRDSARALTSRHERLFRLGPGLFFLRLRQAETQRSSVRASARGFRR